MEFLYTRQQMEGFKGYQSKVKIGNWSEDLEFEAAKLKGYLLKKERGQLKCTQVRPGPEQHSPRSGSVRQGEAGERTIS
jgi:hypothetical protein